MFKNHQFFGGSALAAAAAVIVAFVALALSAFVSTDGAAATAAPSIDRVTSTHVSLVADLASAQAVAEPIRNLPSDINATSPVVRAAGTSNPLIALPASLTRAADALAGGPSPYYGPQTPGGVSAAVDAKGMINYDTMFLNALTRYMKINTIDVSWASATGLGKNVEFLIDSGAGHSNNYTLDSRWSLVTWAGAGLGGLVKGTDVSGKNLGASTNTIVTAISAGDITATRTAAGMNFTGSMTVTDEGDVAGSGQYSGVHAMDPGLGTRDIGTTVGTDTITATADYPKAMTYQLLTMNSIITANAQRMGVSSNSYITMRASDAVLGLSESNGTGVTLGTTHQAWYQTTVDTALSNSPFLVLALVALIAATCVAMWNPDGMTRNHRAVHAIGAG